MAARGVRGIVGLARKFRIMDDDSSGVLSMAEFKKGMRETSLDLSEQVSEARLSSHLLSLTNNHLLGLQNPLLLF
jgi:Ca2+-binding EF-hand superfamily protein